VKTASPRWRFGRAVVTPLVRWLLHLRVEGRENVSRSHPQIIACNHTSHVDPILVAYASGIETWFLSKAEVFRVSPAFAWLIRTYHAMPVNRSGGDLTALRRCSEVLEQGRTLVLFPEGTRSKPGTLQELKPGIAMLAVTNRVPVVPVFMHGVRGSFIPWLVDPDIIRYNQRQAPGRLRFRLSSLWDSQVRVRFGSPLLPDGYERNKAGYLRLTGRLEQALVGLREGLNAG
jgi:1-acyl-sn-glycerol-3-phosphate acyltransferase